MQCYIDDRRCVLVDTGRSHIRYDGGGNIKTYSPIIINVDGKPVNINYDSCVREYDGTIPRSEFENLAELCVSIADDWILSEEEIDLCTTY